MKNHTGSILLLITAMIWGCNFVAQSVSMDYLGPYTFTFFRFLLASICLLPIAFFSIKRYERKQGAAHMIVKNSIKAGVYCGGFMALATIFQQVAIVSVSAGKAGFITSLYIVLVPVILFFFFKEKMGKNEVLAIMVAIVGFYLLCIQQNSWISRYDLCLLVTTLCYSLQIITISRYQEETLPLVLALTQFIIVMVISFGLMIAYEKVDLVVVGQCALPLGYAAILSSAIGQSLQVIGQKSTSASLASLIMSLQSVFAVLFGWLLLNDVLTTREMVGCVLIFCAFVIAQYQKKIS